MKLFINTIFVLILSFTLCTTAFADSLTKGVMSRSYASKEQIAKVVAGTRLEGCEDHILYTEYTYGVNAIYILAVAKTETGYGAAGVGRSHKNNLFGITASDGFATYSSPAESVTAFGKLMSEKYFPRGYDTLTKIGPVYCDSDWSLKVENDINTIYNQMQR